MAALSLLAATPGCAAPAADPTTGPAVTASREPAARRDAAPPTRPHRAVGQWRGEAAARFELVSPAALVRLRAADLAGSLYRVSTPPDSGLAPVVRRTAGGGVRLALRPTGQDGPDTVDITLNRRVGWSIRLGAGAGEHHIDLRSARVDALAVGAGAGLVRARLPHPSGTVPVLLTGAVGRAEVRLPASVPVRLRLARGAGVVTTAASRRVGVPAATVLTDDGWPSAEDRYLVDARRPVGALSVLR